MALDFVQRRLFVHTVDLYRPVPMPGGTSAKGATGNKRFSLAYSAVLCYVEFTAEFDQPQTGVGRTKTINFETLDVLHVEFAQEVDDGWKYQFKTSGHVEAGGWWSVLGNAKSLDKANTKELFSRRDLSPPKIVTV